MINKNQYNHYSNLELNETESLHILKSVIYELTYKGDFSAKDFYFHESNPLENIFTAPFPNERNIWHLKLLDGLDLYFIETNSIKKIEIPKEILTNEYSFFYTINGKSLFKILSKTEDFITNTNPVYTVPFPFKSQQIDDKNSISTYLLINFNLSVFINFLDKNIFSSDQIDNFKNALLQNKDSIFLYSPFINDFLTSLVFQIQKMPFGRKYRREFIELKFIELIWTTIFEYVENPKKNTQNMRLSKRDYDKLKRAKDLLISNLEEPPTLPELAKMIGLNEYKFKIGFKKIFGLPPYAFLQDYKLEIAKNLLEEGDKTVTEVAIKIGYSNFSKFSSAFKKKFGKNPSKILSK